MMHSFHWPGVYYCLNLLNFRTWLVPQNVMKYSLHKAEYFAHIINYFVTFWCQQGTQFGLALWASIVLLKYFSVELTNEWVGFPFNYYHKILLCSMYFVHWMILHLKIIVWYDRCELRNHGFDSWLLYGISETRYSVLLGKTPFLFSFSYCGFDHIFYNWANIDRMCIQVKVKISHTAITLFTRIEQK